MSVYSTAVAFQMLTQNSLDTAGTEQFTAMRECTVPFLQIPASTSDQAFLNKGFLLDLHSKSFSRHWLILKVVYMKQGQGFLLVFSITSMNSFYELAELREQIIRVKDDDDIPLVLVGNKSDMEDQRVVPRGRAFQLAQEWGQKPYYETSARRRTNVDEVFVNLTRPQTRNDRPVRQDRRRRRNRDRCIIL